MSEAITYFAIFAAGFVVSDLMWRWLSKKQSELIEAQKTLIDEQSGALSFIHSCKPSLTPTTGEYHE